MKEIDPLLELATIPEPPEGFEARMMARLPSSVVPFKLRWAALPLAASLALGIYLGATEPAEDDLSGVAAVMDYSAEDAS